MTTTDPSPIEVTAEQYRYIMVDCAGCCAGRKEDGKFYIKIWNCGDHIRKYLAK